MRFFNKYAYMGAIALVGAVGFTACSSEDDLTAQQNPTFDGESVKTQFAINIPYGGKGTRMSVGATQGDNTTFNGMQSIYLIPSVGAIDENTDIFTSVIPLSNFDKFETGSTNYKLYNDVNIPVGTTHFLFYGIGGQTIPSDASGKFANGILKSTLPSTASAGDVKFNLEKILTGGEFTIPQTNLLKVLNGVASAADWSTQQESSELGGLYKNYKTLKGGSANSIKLTMEELYNAVNNLATATSESTEKTIAVAIQDAIKIYFEVNGAAAPYTLAWRTDLAEENKIVEDYPTGLNVPEGAAQVTWDDNTSQFKYVDYAIVGTPSDPQQSDDKVVNVYNLCYPASLAYFVNTPLKATTKKNVTWPNSASAWESEVWDTWADAVDAATQTVALKNNIQYGVANLNTTVTCKTSTLEDNALEVASYSANQHIVVPSDGFPVTGLLVGGQPDFASWDMTPFDNNFTMTVYDNSLTGISAKYNAVSAKNYTLLLDNTVADNNHKIVNIALELTNNSGTDFYGVDGKIAKGAKFYLVAQLNPTGTGVTQPDPDKPQLTDVFIKDYVTTANLTITSLKNAYVTIPDLRSSELVLGLSVDLTWQEGLTFDVTID